jgi:DNA invertase Pin-like site-specific DNA recombinase
MNGKRVGLYLRVSTDEQTVENQRQSLTEAIERRSWRIVETFEDNGISGAKGREKRPGYDRLLKAATNRKIDIVAAWSVDRLGRSLQDLVGFLAELNAVGCDLYLEKQAVDTTTPAGRALFQMLGVFAEFERAILQDRIHAGIARARRNGTKSGKPIGRQSSARRKNRPYAPRWRLGTVSTRRPSCVMSELARCSGLRRALLVRSRSCDEQA